MNSAAYAIPGSYLCKSNALAETLINSPMDAAFILIVQNVGGGDHLQTFYDWKGKTTVKRVYTANSYGVKYRYLTNSDLDYVDLFVDTVSNSDVAIPNAPNSSFYIPVVVAHSSSNKVQEHVFYDQAWRITSNFAQKVLVRFYKYPV